MQVCVAQGDPDRACGFAVAAVDEAEQYGLGLWPEEIRKARMTFRSRGRRCCR
ncbi:MAG: hypothetical protein ACRDYA_15180 [Egibacteraceae bacterium]